MLLGHPEFSVQPTGAIPTVNSLFFHIDQGKVLMDIQNEEYLLPSWPKIQALLTTDFVPFELAHAGKNSIFSVFPHTSLKLRETNNLKYIDFQVFRSLPTDIAGLLTGCRHLWNWYENNRYCGKCTAKLKPDEKERALLCPDCGNMIFPTIAPAVIVAITCGEKILLARNVRYQHYALIAGYVEVGETLEHALRREVREEVGLEIHDIRYLGDQPWGASGSHMFGFHAHADDSVPIHIQESELADARWFERTEIEPIPHKVSIAYELMERFRLGKL